jgi:hypothetical protein
VNREGEVSEQQTIHPPRRRAVPVRGILLLIVVGALIAFGFLNATPVRVRPFGDAPLCLVLVAPFVAGVVVGWIIRARIGSRPRRAESPDKARGSAT